MAMTGHRLGNPIAQVESAILEIPDDMNFGTGSFSVVFNRKAFSPDGVSFAVGIANPPRIQCFMEVNRARSLLGIVLNPCVSSEEPLPTTQFMLPKHIKTGERHAATMRFIDWRVESVSFDNLPLEAATMLKAERSPTIKMPRPDITTPLGVAIFKYAYLEHTVRSALYSASGLSMELFREMVKDPRIEDVVAMTNNVLRHRSIAVQFDFASLANRLAKAKKRRDQVAHGVFVEDPKTGGPAVIDVDGRWAVDPQGDTWKKKTMPGIQLADAAFWEDLDREFSELTILAEKLADTVEVAQRPSQEKSP